MEDLFEYLRGADTRIDLAAVSGDEVLDNLRNADANVHALKLMLRDHLVEPALVRIGDDGRNEILVWITGWDSAESQSEETVLVTINLDRTKFSVRSFDDGDESAPAEVE